MQNDAGNAAMCSVKLFLTMCSSFLGLLLRMYHISLLVPRQPRPIRLEALLARIEPRERMRLGVKHDLIERQQVVGAEEQVEVLERLGLHTRKISTFPCTLPTPGPGRVELTSQKLSILSLFGGGTSMTSPTLVNPPPFSTSVCLTNASNISQPHSRYSSSPVMRHM